MRNANINNAIARSLSRDRLDKYLGAAGSDLDLAIGFYEFNTRLSEAFYTPLQALEVCFRNHLDSQLTAVYGADWTTNGRAPLRPNERTSIDRAVKDLKQAKAPVTPGAIVAELSFGFWVALLGPRYDGTTWRAALYRAFSVHGRRLARDPVHKRFNAIRRFRNRVAHHEPIFHLAADERHAEVLEAMRWMCEDTAAWAAHHSRVDAVLAAR